MILFVPGMSVQLDNCLFPTAWLYPSQSRGYILPGRMAVIPYYAYMSFLTA